MESAIEQMKKNYKAIRHAKAPLIQEDLERITADLHNPVAMQSSPYRLHIVPVNGIPCIAADAKYLNKHTNQSGRGNVRFLFSPQTKQLYGLAIEQDSGDYRKVA